jgi:cytochrome c
MNPDDPIDNPLGSPLKVPSFVGYVVVLVGCLFALFYTYETSRESAPAPTQQGPPTARPSDQLASTPSAKPGAPVADASPSAAQPKAAAPAEQAAAPPATQSPQGAAPSPAAAAQEAGTPASSAAAPSQGTQPNTATQTAKSSDDLELAFKGHCRECHSFEKNDNRLGPSLYGVVGRKAGSVPNFNYSDSVKNSRITWDEATLDKWITNPDAFIPNNDMGALFPGLPDEAERAKIISFLKQDTQIATPARGSANAPHQTN